MGEPVSFVPFSVSLPGTEDAVRPGLARVLEALAPLSLNVDDAGTVELVLAETLNNVVEHALATSTADTVITVEGDHKADGLWLTVIDRGAPMPEGIAPQARQPDIDVAVEDMPEGGFGWFMIHTLVDEVRYARIDGANHLTLHLSLKTRSD